MKGGGDLATVTEKFVDFFDMVGQTEWNKSMQRSLIHWIGLTGAELALDAGCGAGRLLLQLAQRATWVTGVDSSDAMIKRAEFNTADNEVTNASFRVANIRRLPFADASFDLVVCADLIFLLDDPQPALSEFLRVCTESGQVVIMNPAATMNPWSAKTYCEKHRLRDFERDSLLAWATACARRSLLTGAQMDKIAHECGGKLTHTVHLLDNMASVFRIVPQGVDKRAHLTSNAADLSAADVGVAVEQPGSSSLNTGESPDGVSVPDDSHL